MTTHITGILLTYYPSYFEKAVKQFNALLRSLPGKHSLVVVHNGPGLKSVRAGLEILAGNNSHREFSGWEVGLDYCRRNGLIEQSDLVVFANDTFCHHNKFGPLTRFTFRKALRRLLRDPSTPALAGEVHRLGKPYCIDGLVCDRWVATYLFGMSHALVAQLDRLTPATPMTDFYQQQTDKLEFSDLVSPNLARHIEQWLTGSGATRWKGAAAGEAQTLAQLQGKANSVLCEKYLTARALSSGGKLSDVFASAALRQLRRLEALPSKLALLLGRQQHPEIYGG